MSVFACCSNAVEYTVWDRWEVHGSRDFTVKQFIQALQVKSITDLLKLLFVK